jgi:IS30 family transposase
MKIKKKPLKVQKIYDENTKYIYERPNESRDRLQSGHYELDLVPSRKYKSALLVMIDRLTRETIIRKIKNKFSSSVNRSILKILLKNQVKTITIDDGTEFSKLNSLERYNLKVYYCNPYAS